MSADALPGNAASTVPAYAPSSEQLAAQLGLTRPSDPGTDQAQLAGASFQRGLMAGAVAQGRGPGDPRDVTSPQVFPVRPSQRDAVQQSSVGDETATQELPGRVRPLFDDSSPGGYL